MKKERFNFNKDFKLYEACSEEDRYRPAMEMVHFMNDAAYASNSHILVKVPLDACIVGLDIEDAKKLNGFSVQWKVLKKIYALDRIFIQRDDEAGTCEIQSEINGHDIRIELKSQAQLKVPGFDKVLGERESAEPTTKIGISPSLLYKLSRAINMTIVSMKMTSKNGKIFINGEGNGAVSVIMPILTKDDL